MRRQTARRERAFPAAPEPRAGAGCRRAGGTSDRRGALRRRGSAGPRWGELRLAARVMWGVGRAVDNKHGVDLPRAGEWAVVARLGVFDEASRRCSAFGRLVGWEHGCPLRRRRSYLPSLLPPLGQPCSPGARRASAPTPLCVGRQITAIFSSRCRAAPGPGHRAAGSAEQGRASPLPLMQWLLVLGPL